MEKRLDKKYTEKKPWGQFEQFIKNEPSTVKILTINPHEALSLQYHRHREEFWKVLCGNPKITVGDTVNQANEGNEFFIARGQNHQIQAGGFVVKVLEISFGDFDENDIVRLEDRYSKER